MTESEVIARLLLRFPFGSKILVEPRVPGAPPPPPGTFDMNDVQRFLDMNAPGWTAELDGNWIRLRKPRELTSLENRTLI